MTPYISIYDVELCTFFGAWFMYDADVEFWPLYFLLM